MASMIVDLPISFRAGGNHIEPFDTIKKVFTNNSIFIDSSKIGMPNKNKEKKISIKPFYKFSSTPSIIDENGLFFEFPITTINISLIRKIWFKFLKRRYKHLDKFGDGTSMGESVIKKQLLLERIYKFISNSKAILTPEGNFQEKFNYLIKKCPDYSLMTLHPKYLNLHQIEMLKDLLEKKKVRFISIADYIKQNDVM